MAMVREQDAFFVAGTGAGFPVVPRRGRSGVGRARIRRRPVAGDGGDRGSRRVRGDVRSAGRGLLVLNGHLGPHASVGHKMNWMAPHALQVLFSPEHGFFVWTPLALVALAGLVRVFRTEYRLRSFRRRRQSAASASS